MKEVLFPCPDVFLIGAIADATAMAVEDLKPGEHLDHIKEALKLERYLPNPEPAIGHRAGFYTDDEESDVACAQVLIRYDLDRITPVRIANALVEEHHRGGKRPGYSKGLQPILGKVKNGTELIAALKTDSTRNGAAIRAFAFGVIPDIDELLRLATLQAAVTHNTPEGLFSSRAVALMAHYALYEPRPLRDIDGFCLQHLPADDRDRFAWTFTPRRVRVPVVHTAEVPVALSTVQAVVDHVRFDRDLRGSLHSVMDIAGDTDSIASLVLKILATRLKNNLPAFMERDLDGGSPLTGAPYLRHVGKMLMRKFRLG